MAAVYCGTKRSHFEDLPSQHSSKRSHFEDLPSQHSSKRFRCYSPSNFPIWSSPSSSLDQLRNAFPHLKISVLVKALEEHGSDLDAAMKSLYSLVVSAEEEKKSVELASEGATEETDKTTDNSPISGDDWVELIVREVTQSTGTDDAKVRAGRVLEALEKMLSARAHEEVGKKFQEENVAVQLQVESLIKDNKVLKRAVAIQHERQKSFDDVNQQLELLKPLIPQYQEKLRTLEVNNYALRMHLQQVEHGSSMPGRFNPDVF